MYQMHVTFQYYNTRFGGFGWLQDLISVIVLFSLSNENIIFGFGKKNPNLEI